MKKVEVLGTGCAKCRKLYETVRKVGSDLGIELELKKVEDINEIVDYGVMMTPALVVDGSIVSSGKALSEEEVARLLS